MRDWQRIFAIARAERRRDCEEIIARLETLDAAIRAMEAEFESRPRRSPMIDRYCRARNEANARWWARDYLECDMGSAADCRRRLDKEFPKVARFHAKLKADPYVASERRVKEWREHYRVQRLLRERWERPNG